ncbi:MAG: 4Fe-4S dicluster domain-containing protein [Candidatus Bathyarchaeota archaeon]|nr:4Fe-4S dicluster domain-containing protein [Candidatus Bathyarchaeum sp.]
MLKKEDTNKLVVERILHAKNYCITLDKTKCKGCGICEQICPREAIQTIKHEKKPEEKAKQPTVDINKEKCNYCGMCDAICPFGAITVEINGEHKRPVVESESFPELKRNIQVDPSKCNADCKELEQVCPLDLIQVTVPDKENQLVKIEIDEGSCPCCRLCETEVPNSPIHVEKMFKGKLRIDTKKCPEGCSDCVDVCPIPGVLVLSDSGKVEVNEQNCVYCGACKVVCPKEGALALERTQISHTPVHSGAWNSALEKLASVRAVTKELQTKSTKRRKQSVENRFPEEEKK